MKSFYKEALLLLFFLFSTLYVQATHIRAGEIIVERISPQSLTFRITIIGYTDTGSQVQFGGGGLEFGDGTSVQIDTEKDFSTKEILGDEIALNTFVITHTYPAPGNYTLRFFEQNRNAGVLNMFNSVDTPFYVETNITIDPFIGLNNSPQLLIPPIDRAATGVRFIHNPGAFDPDGDSLSYKIVTPKQDIDLEVGDYTLPNNQKHYSGLDYGTANQDKNGPPTYTLDPLTGDLVWDSPGAAGEYNVAFIVEEWRKIQGQWRKLGYVTRDMQIIVEETDNEPPELIIPNDTCVVAGDLLEKTIFAIDPDNDDVIVEAFGGVFGLLSSPATFSPNPPVIQPTTPSPAELDFSWQTNCFHVRERPYEIQFKVRDKPPVVNSVQPPSLSDFKTWKVTVIGPKPEGLTAVVQAGRAIQLNWDNYGCANATHTYIYRRVDSFDYTPDYCETGIREGSGYELIDSVAIGTTDYFDNNNGEGLDPGAKYCYRLVAIFPLPAGGQSVVSEEICALLEADAPVITNVTIEKTGETDGEILVKWTPPFEIDQINFPPPYKYTIARAEGFNGESGLTVLGTTTGNDTTFTDTGLDTENKVYNYRIYLADNTDLAVDTSAVASSVRLELESFVGGIELNWRADVPWSNNITDFPMHYIYRDRAGADPTQLVLIDSVNVLSSSFKYIDNGSFNGEALSDKFEYCYYVITKGSYGNPEILSPLTNLSQIICAQPNDTISPCTPVNLALLDCEDFLDGAPCNNQNYENTLTWEMDDDADCDNDIRSFNIYFSPTEDGAYDLIDNVTSLIFLHENLSSFGGCYKVSAVDRSKNESPLSEAVCITSTENCLRYNLPNVFTPNNDTKNDTFEAYGGVLEKCPQFVEKVVFNVYNRLGRKIFEYESGGENSIHIDWDGRTTGGKPATNGIYYYEATVTFNVFDPKLAERKIKGWIHLLK